MEMVKRDTAYWIAFVWYMIGGLFGASFWLTIASGVIIGVLFDRFSTKVNFTDDNTENDSNNETDNKEETKNE